MRSSKIAEIRSFLSPKAFVFRIKATAFVFAAVPMDSPDGKEPFFHLILARRKSRSTNRSHEIEAT
jgi:hypothetical protein